MAYFTYQMRGLNGKTMQTNSAPTGGASGGWSAGDYQGFVSALGPSIASVIEAATGSDATPPNWNQEPSIGQNGETPETGPSFPSTMGPQNGASSMAGIPWYVYVGGGLVALLLLGRVLRS